MSLTEFYHPSLVLLQNHLFLLKCLLLSLLIILVFQKCAHFHWNLLLTKSCPTAGKLRSSELIVSYSYLYHCSAAYELGSDAREAEASKLLQQKREITRQKRGSSRRHETAKRLRRQEEATANRVTRVLLPRPSGTAFPG